LSVKEYSPKGHINIRMPIDLQLGKLLLKPYLDTKVCLTRSYWEYQPAPPRNSPLLAELLGHRVFDNNFPSSKESRTIFLENAGRP